MFQRLGEAQQPKQNDSSMSLCDKVRATAAATLILGSYKRSDVDDPKIYVANAVAVLMRFSEAIVREVCEPGAGIQTKIDWPPNQKELRQECERIAGEHAQRRHREMLNRHRVLIDTPQGLRPESEVAPSVPRLSGPAAVETEAERRQRAYDYAMAVKQEIKASGEEPDPSKPPPGMTDVQKRAWYAERLDARLAEISARNAGSPVVIGEGLARKLAAMQDEHRAWQEAAE
jgi:hypothetical protein